jgi:triosephosphate isomerase
MTRLKILAGNWKMNKLKGDIAPFFQQLNTRLAAEKKPLSAKKAEVVFAMPFTLLAAGAEAAKPYGFTVAAQNIHWADTGAFTGEVSCQMLADIGVGWTLIGHSERRQYFGETDQTVAKKVKQALTHGICPIACVGETLEEREKGLTETVIKRQVEGVFQDLGSVGAKELACLVIAYEPVWAIGTGRAASSDDAQAVHVAIRQEVARLAGKEFSQGLRILYGGSASPKNIDELFTKPDIDGALVGGASLVAEDFAKMILAAH